MYNNERAFSSAMLQKLRSLQFVTYRLETGGTSIGVPDIFAQRYTTDYWIELKNDKHAILEQNTLEVAWRPGQQAWAAQYRSNHSLYPCFCRVPITIVALRNGFVIIPMDTLYERNIVNLSTLNVRCFTTAQWRKLNAIDIQLATVQPAITTVTEDASYDTITAWYLRALYRSGILLNESKHDDGYDSLIYKAAMLSNVIVTPQAKANITIFKRMQYNIAAVSLQQQ